MTLTIEDLTMAAQAVRQMASDISNGAAQTSSLAITDILQAKANDWARLADKLDEIIEDRPDPNVGAAVSGWWPPVDESGDEV